MIDTLYTAVRTRLKTISAVKWIDLDSGQLDNPEDNYPFPFPAVFADFSPIDWQDGGEKLQDGVVTMTLRIATRVYQQTHGATQDTAYDTFGKAMTLLQILNTVQASIQGLSGTNFNGFTRVSTTTEKRSDGLKVFQVTYHCMVRDTCAMKQYTTVIPDAITISQGISRAHLRVELSAADTTPEISTETVISVAVENTGIEAGTGAVATIGLSDGLTHSDNDGGATYGPTKGVVTWNAGTLSAGQVKTLNITVFVNGVGPYTADATLVYSGQGDPPSHNTDTITLVPVAAEGD